MGKNKFGEAAPQAPVRGTCPITCCMPEWLVDGVAGSLIVSPVFREILRPRSLRMVTAEALNTPKVSTAIIMKSYVQGTTRKPCDCRENCAMPRKFRHTCI